MKLSFKFSLLFWLITFSFFARLATSYIFGDQVIDNEWNILVNNLINYKSFSFYVTDEQIIPSVYMPPMYPFFLYFTKLYALLYRRIFLSIVDKIVPIFVIILLIILHYLRFLYFLLQTNWPYLFSFLGLEGWFIDTQLTMSCNPSSYNATPTVYYWQCSIE